MQYSYFRDAMKLSRVQRIIDVCDGWGEGRGILNFKASGPVERYIPWVRYWRPEIEREGKHFFWKKLIFIFCE